MGMHMSNNVKSTGLARCKVCDEIIKKGTICVYASGWRTAGHCHKTCPKVKK